MLKELLHRYPQLAGCEEDLKNAVADMIRCYENGGKVLLCGNGGSCADADHIVGELMKGFLKKRSVSPEEIQSMQQRCPELEAELAGKLQKGLPALSLCSLTALNTAFCNDVDPELCYAQTVFAMGKPGDLLIGISTSGNAKNVAAAAKVAKAMGIRVIGLTGAGGGKLKTLADICIRVPEAETFRVQELHLPVYHYLCAAVEAHFFAQ